jgi:hypothetical protein
MAEPLYSFLNRLEFMMRGALKRGFTKFTAESVHGALRAPFRRVSRFITHAAAAKALTKRGDNASPLSASSPSSFPLITLTLEESLLAPPAPLSFSGPLPSSVDQHGQS